MHEPLVQFFKNHQDIDIFCLQEVYHKAPQKISTEDRLVRLDILTEISELLPEHRVYFRPILNDIYGIAMLVGPKVAVLSEIAVNVYHNPEYVGVGPAHDRELQHLKILHEQKELNIFNFHGLWNGKGKSDSPERIEQARNVRNHMDTVDSPKILMGDFNMRPQTESLAILDDGMRNLILENKITSTRTSYYPKTERFADYAIVSSDIDVKQFEILPDEVSDHNALYLEVF